MRVNLIIFFLCMFTGACSSFEQGFDRVEYVEVSLSTLQSILTESVQEPYPEGSYSPRWFYAGTRDEYHYFYYFFPTYLNYKSTPLKRINFFKVLTADLDIPREIEFSDDMREHEEVFKRPSAFANLTFEELYELRMEDGDAGHIKVDEYSIFYLPFKKEVKESSGVYIEEYYASERLKRRYLKE